VSAEDDPNRQLGPFVEGLIMGAILADWPRLDTNTRAIGWKMEMVELDRHALVFTSPTKIKWRIVAQIIEDDSTPSQGSGTIDT
jgi:hypothetical protein